MKNAMELQINFLVILILSMSVLILSSLLIRNVVNKSSHLTDQVNSQIKKRIEKTLLESENKVSIPFQFVNVQGWGIANFAIGIKNNDESCSQFNITVSSDTAYAFNKSKISNFNNYFFIDQKYTSGFKINVKNNELIIKNIGIKIKKGAEKGVYIFNVYVYDLCDNKLFSSPMKVYAVVK